MVQFLFDLNPNAGKTQKGEKGMKTLRTIFILLAIAIMLFGCSTGGSNSTETAQSTEPATQSAGQADTPQDSQPVVKKGTVSFGNIVLSELNVATNRKGYMPSAGVIAASKELINLAVVEFSQGEEIQSFSRYRENEKIGLDNFSINAGEYEVKISLYNKDYHLLFSWKGSVTVEAGQSAQKEVWFEFTEEFPYYFYLSIPEDAIFTPGETYNAQVLEDGNVIAEYYIVFEDDILHTCMDISVGDHTIVIMVADDNGIEFQSEEIEIGDDVIVDDAGIVTSALLSNSGTVDFDIHFEGENGWPYRLVKSKTSDTIFLISSDARFVFPNDQQYRNFIMDSWDWTMDDVEIIDQSDIESLRIKGVVTIRPGTYLVKREGYPEIYAVEYNDVIAQILSEKALIMLYGEDYLDRVITIPDAYWASYNTSFYPVDIQELENPFGGTPFEEISRVPTGSMIMASYNSEVAGILVGNSFSKLLTAKGLRENRYQEKFFVNGGWGIWNYPSKEEYNPINGYLSGLDFYSDVVWSGLIGNLNTFGEQGELGKITSFEWDAEEIPRNLKEGDLVEITYCDGTFSETKTTIAKKLWDGTLYLHVEWDTEPAHVCNLALFTITVQRSYGVTVLLAPGNPASQVIFFGETHEFLEFNLFAGNEDIFIQEFHLGATGMFRSENLDSITVTCKNDDVVLGYVDDIVDGEISLNTPLLIPANGSLTFVVEAYATGIGDGNVIGINLVDVLATNIDGESVGSHGLPINGNSMILHQPL